MRLAIVKANSLSVPLIIAGDMHDSKANLRGECVNAIIKTIQECATPPYILVGNHSRINERAPEHALHFLAPYSNLIDTCLPIPAIKAIAIPYHHDPDELRAYLKKAPKGSTLIMHQGIEGSDGGDYIQDKSAINHEDVAGMRIISGHYHNRQTIDLPEGGRFDYIGNPYTLTYGEAKDLPKGFQVLYNDGSLEFVPTNLRKHIVIEHDLSHGNATMPINANPGDLIWVKLTGSKEQLASYKKHDVADIFDIEGAFRLDLIPLIKNTQKQEVSVSSKPHEILDSLIDSASNTSDNRKIAIKSLWRSL